MINVLCTHNRNLNAHNKNCSLHICRIDNTARSRSDYLPLNFKTIAVAQMLSIGLVNRVANRPGFPGTVPELACGVPCPGQGRFFSRNFSQSSAIQYNTIRDAILTCARVETSCNCCIHYRCTSHGPVSVCVRLSVTSRSSTKTAKQRITQTTPHDSTRTLVFWRQRSPRNSTEVTPYEGA